MAAAIRARRGPCCICGRPIDYALPFTDGMAFTVAHDKPKSTHPHLAEDPGNLKGAAHRSCNAREGNREPGLLTVMGATSFEW